MTKKRGRECKRCGRTPEPGPWFWRAAALEVVFAFGFLLGAVVVR